MKAIVKNSCRRDEYMDECDSTIWYHSNMFHFNPQSTRAPLSVLTVHIRGPNIKAIVKNSYRWDEYLDECDGKKLDKPG